MKRTYCFLLLLTVSIGFSQSLEKLKSDTKKMYDASYNIDFETILDYTYPKFFDFSPREAMLKGFDESFQNEKTKMRFVYPSVTFNYSEIKTIDGRKFCVIRYKNAVRLTYEEKLTAEDSDALLKVMKESKKFETVSFENKRNSFLLVGNAILLAISDELTKGEWKFINYDDERIFEMLFAKNYKTELGL